jgi:hypothetical protein
VEILAVMETKLTCRRLFQLLRLRDELFRSHPHTKIFRQIDPANQSVRIDKEFSGPRDVMSVDSCSFVQQVICANRRRVWIGKKRKCEAGFLAQISRLFRRVHTDRNGLHAQAFDFAQPVLYSP